MATKKTATAENKIKVTLIKSTIACIPNQIKVVEALGLKKIGSSRIHDANPCIMGMIKKVNHLVKVEKI